MNVTFHTAAAIATAVTLLPLDNRRATEVRLKSLMMKCAAGFLVGVAVHGLLDTTPHTYPIDSKVDVILSLGMVAALCIRAPLLSGICLIACFAGAVFPDVFDQGPPLMNKYAGTSLPTWTVFPWHWPEYSGSIYDGGMHLDSLLLHIAVILICASVFTRRVLLRRDRN